MKTAIKKTAAVILCLIMLTGIMTAGAFASEDKLFYMVLGDSIGYGSGLRNSRQACYGKIVADTNGYDYANDAIPGHTTQNLLDRLENEEVIKHVKQADIISISIGGNNFLLGNMAKLLFDVIVKGDDSLARETVDGFYKDFDEIVKKIRSYNPDAVILMQTLYNPQTGYVGEAYQVAIDILNEAIVRYAQENEGAIVIVDVATRVKDSEKDFAQDGIHPSVQGNEKIARAVLEKLAELGLGEKTEPVITEKGADISVPSVFTAPLKLYGNVLHFISLLYGVFA
jgi:lysophospholipase L1-like esterase